MEVFTEYLNQIVNQEYRNRIEEIFKWIETQFPNLKREFKWNQPMYSDHGTYIIGFSISKQHISVAPENAGIIHFAEAIEKAGYDYTNQIFRIKWNQTVDFELLEKIIQYNIIDKAECKTFWR
ncbi:MAG: iron chaperone [Anaerolineaceae bacterium]|nr:MAG: iron chaperone [Anaerolineaceae bacterium]